MTKQAKQKAIEDLHAIISNYAVDAYLQTNKKKNGTFYKKSKPYSLPVEVKTCINYISILNQEELTKTEEEEVKVFLLIYRISRTEYLTNADASI